MSDATHKPERVVLTRDLSEFLIELSIALHRHSMYPSGHPSLEPAVSAVTRRAERLLEDRPSLAFGVARRQLIIEGVATDPNQPVLRRLAEGLHRHHLGAVTVSRGVQEFEVSEALRTLATEAEKDGPLGLEKGGGRLTVWPHVKLHPVTFDGLALVGDAPLSKDGSGGGSRPVELWIGLARAAMSADASAESESVPIEPTAVARSIDEHPQAEAYDQVIVGYMLQIAEELKTASGAETIALRRRTSALVASLRPETLRRLVEMGGDATQRGAFVLDAAHGMAVDAVLQITKAAAAAGGQTISHGLVRMLSKLAAHAEQGSETARPLADAALREQVSRLQEGWTLEDPNPTAYGRVLQHLATTTGASDPGAESWGDHLGDGPDALRLLQMGLETGALGPLLERAIDRAVAAGEVTAVLELLTARPEGADAASDAIMARLTAPPTLRALLAQEPIDIASLDGLIPFLSANGFDVLLDGLAASENRGTRRRLLDRLSHTAPDIGLSVAARLQDDRWYVQRNMLVLLERSGRIPAGFSVTPWTTHPDLRLRSEGIRLQLSMPGQRDLALTVALDDADPRIVRLGLAAMQRDCPPEYADRVAALATSPESDEENRLLAVTTLGRCREPRARDALLQLTHGGRSLLGRLRLPPKTPLFLAAVRVLADVWSTDSKVAGILALAAASSDPEVREAAVRVGDR